MRNLLIALLLIAAPFALADSYEGLPEGVTLELVQSEREVEGRDGSLVTMVVNQIVAYNSDGDTVARMPLRMRLPDDLAGAEVPDGQLSFVTATGLTVDIGFEARTYPVKGGDTVIVTSLVNVDGERRSVHAAVLPIRERTGENVRPGNTERVRR